MAEGGGESGHNGEAKETLQVARECIRFEGTRRKAKKKNENTMNGTMNEWLGLDGSDGGPPPTSPGRSHEFEVTMAHKLKFWKEGHARRKPGNSSQRARDCGCWPRLLIIFSSSVLAKVSEKVAIRLASTRSKDDDDVTVLGAASRYGWLDEAEARRRCIEDQYNDSVLP